MPANRSMPAATLIPVIPALRTLAILPLIAIAVATRAAAQEQPPVPPCEGQVPEAAPCRARYDTAPVLDPAPEPPLAEGEPRTPLVWIFVDETGAVRRAQVQRPTGPEWDYAAVQRARQLHFRPAALAGMAVVAWVLMPVTAVPPPASCADASMSVPLSAGALFVDSTGFDRPELGTRFTYVAEQGFGIDLFVYPRPEGETPRGEVEKTLAVLRQGSVAGGPESIAVLRARPERARSSPRGAMELGGHRAVVVHAQVHAPGERVRPDPRYQEVEFAGYSAVFRARLGGNPVESYIGVFPAGGEYLKVRATYPRTRGARGQVWEFVDQILSHRAWRMKGCQR
jgi:hypothetical protein